MRKFGLALAMTTGVLLGSAVAAQASTIVSGVWHLDASAGPAAYAHSLENFESYGSPPSGGTNLTGTLHGTGAYSGSTTTTAGNVKVVQGDKPNQHTFPTDSTNYLSIFGSGQSGKLTISLSAGAHYLGFLWGTIDGYNTISFLDKLGNTLASFTGDDFNFAGKVDHQSSAYANFTTSASIWTVILGSTKQNSFELDNISVAAVPVPAALPMFGAILVGLVAFQTRRRSRLTA